MNISRVCKNFFRSAFPQKSETDFPGGYIPNRFFLEHIDKGPVLVVGDYKGREYPPIKTKIKESYLLDIVNNNVAESDFFIFQSLTEPIPFPDNYFRYVVIAEVIEHIWEDRQALIEVRRVLAPSGKLLLSVPLLHDFPDHHFHIYSPKSILTLMRFSGFSVLSVCYRGLVVSIPNGIVAGMALLLFPFLGSRALPYVNKCMYRVHILLGNQKKLNSLFRLSHVCKGYGMMIVAQKYAGEIPNPIQAQQKDFQI